MSEIGAVLGWRFNNQSGMSTFDGVITEFPGEVPSDEDIATWTAEYAVYKTIMDEIERLEELVTQRRIRDSVTTDDGKQWMVDQEALIATERGKL
jgi:gamma-glutamylcyclotransferase (GGCT)/AIG2-like uncharacterized protein YtfP